MNNAEKEKFLDNPVWADGDRERLNDLLSFAISDANRSHILGQKCRAIVDTHPDIALELAAENLRLGRQFGFTDASLTYARLSMAKGNRDDAVRALTNLAQTPDANQQYGQANAAFQMFNELELYEEFAPLFENADAYAALTTEREDHYAAPQPLFRILINAAMIAEKVGETGRMAKYLEKAKYWSDASVWGCVAREGYRAWAFEKTRAGAAGFSKIVAAKGYYLSEMKEWAEGGGMGSGLTIEYEERGPLLELRLIRGVAAVVMLQRTDLAASYHRGVLSKQVAAKRITKKTATQMQWRCSADLNEVDMINLNIDVLGYIQGHKKLACDLKHQ